MKILVPADPKPTRSKLRTVHCEQYVSKGCAVSMRTISEVLFEKLCLQRGVAYSRIPEGTRKTADYRVLLGSVILIAEIKQLNENDEDKNLAPVWGTQNSPGAVAPSDRVQGLLEDAYPQIKRSCEGKQPTMIVVYNNSGPWNWIDAFTVAKAMFGSFGFVLGLQRDETIVVSGHGYLGERKVTKDTFRSLSAVGVLKHLNGDAVGLDCYHNPFATIPIEPVQLTALANEQYIHPNPTTEDSYLGRRQELKHKFAINPAIQQRCSASLACCWPAVIVSVSLPS